MFITWLFLFMQIAYSPATTGVRVVYISNGRLMTKTGTASAISVVDDQVPKALPVWSPDGTMIAYLRESKMRLPNLAIISAEGRKIATIALSRSIPNAPGQMRFIDQVTWLSGDRILLIGSVSPSTVEAVVIDRGNGSVTLDTELESPGIFFSPNAQDYAYEKGSPHYAASVTYHPVLAVDDADVYPSHGKDVRFATYPRWSESGTSLAIIAEDPTEKQWSVVVWRHAQPLIVLPFKAQTDSNLDIFWDGNVLYLSENETQYCWSGQQGLTRVAVPIDDPIKAALRFRKALGTHMKAPAVLEPDYWCAACALRVLARSNPLRGAELLPHD